MVDRVAAGNLGDGGPGAIGHRALAEFTAAGQVQALMVGKLVEAAPRELTSFLYLSPGRGNSAPVAQARCTRGTTSGPGFVTSDQWLNGAPPPTLV